MLIKASGSCQKCGVEFSGHDTIQSVYVECNRCGNVKTLCRRCKSEGCDCGGEYKDDFDKNPGLML